MKGEERDQFKQVKTFFVASVFRGPVGAGWLGSAQAYLAKHLGYLECMQLFQKLFTNGILWRNILTG